MSGGARKHNDESAFRGRTHDKDWRFNIHDAKSI
jgi:hypothetical protein